MTDSLQYAREIARGVLCQGAGTPGEWQVAINKADAVVEALAGAGLITRKVPLSRVALTFQGITDGQGRVLITQAELDEVGSLAQLDFIQEQLLAAARVFRPGEDAPPLTQMRLMALNGDALAWNGAQWTWLTPTGVNTALKWERWPPPAETGPWIEVVSRG